MKSMAKRSSKAKAPTAKEQQLLRLRFFLTERWEQISAEIERRPSVDGHFRAYLQLKEFIDGSSSMSLRRLFESIEILHHQGIVSKQDLNLLETALSH